MNCLTFLLSLWREGHRFTIITNENHYVGVNDKKIFELGNEFKKDLQLGYSLHGGDRYLPIDFGALERTIKIFSLNETDQKTLTEYFEFRELKNSEVVSEYQK